MIQKPFSYTLQKTFGIGYRKALQLFIINGLNIRGNPKTLKKKHLSSFNLHLTNIKTGKLLKTEIQEFIEFLIKTRTYKGIRQKLKYPVRGQRTHTNAKTSKKK